LFLNKRQQGRARHTSVMPTGKEGTSIFINHNGAVLSMHPVKV